MADAWLISDSRHPYEAHALETRTTVGGADDDIDVGTPSGLMIERRGDAWFARGSAWEIDDMRLGDHELPLQHGAALRFGMCQLRFVIGDPARGLEEMLHERSVIDPMTKLLTRRALYAHLSRVPPPAALLVIDIDRLKNICNLLGHLAGDEVIRQTANVLRDEVRWPEIAARYGGEEFCVVLPDRTRDDARRRAERIRVACEPDMTIEGTIVNPTVSIGIAMIGEFDWRTTFRVAETNLITAKLSGRNRVVG